MINTQTTLEVYRDGQPDQTYYKALERAQTVESMKHAGAHAIELVGHATKATGIRIGKELLLGYANVFDDINHTDTKAELKE